MKNKQPKQALTQDERHRVDRAVNREILKPKYKRTDKNKQRLNVVQQSKGNKRRPGSFRQKISKISHRRNIYRLLDFCYI
jgi:hypothetical protein